MHVSVCAKGVKKIDESNEVEQDVSDYSIKILSRSSGVQPPPPIQPLLCVAT